MQLNMFKSFVLRQTKVRKPFLKVGKPSIENCQCLQKNKNSYYLKIFIKMNKSKRNKRKMIKAKNKNIVVNFGFRESLRFLNGSFPTLKTKKGC